MTVKGHFAGSGFCHDGIDTDGMYALTREQLVGSI